MEGTLLCLVWTGERTIAAAHSGDLPKGLQRVSVSKEAGLATRTLSPLPLGFKDGNGLLPSLALMGPSGSESGVGTPRAAPGQGACSMVGLGAVMGGSFFGEQASLGWVPAPRCSFLLHARNL